MPKSGKNHLILCFVSLAALLLLSACASTNAYYRSPYVQVESLKPGSIVHVPTGTGVTEAELMDYAASSRIVYVGESHKSINDHLIQLKVIKALHAKYPGKVAVGMEMFQRPSQKVLDAWLAGRASDKELFRQWNSDWGIDFELYREIFDFLREKKIPIIALNVSRKQVMAISRGSHGDKAAKKDAEEPEPLPELDETDPYHRAMVRAVYGDPNHGASGFDKFYRVQLLWEETMAESIVNYLSAKGNDKKRMVVLAGGGHVNFGYGIPRRAFRRLKVPYTTILPVSINVITDAKEAAKKGAEMMDVDIPDAPLHLADFVWATEFETILEPKTKLGVHLVKDKERLVVMAVIPGSSAEAAELMTGDEITRVDGVEISEAVDILYALSRKKNGDTVKVTLKRGENVVVLPVKLKPLPSEDEG
jgi:uncharacterized iron-regulated protein